MKYVISISLGIALMSVTYVSNLRTARADDPKPTATTVRKPVSQAEFEKILAEKYKKGCRGDATKCEDKARPKPSAKPASPSH